MSKKAPKTPANRKPTQKRSPSAIASAPLSTNKGASEAECESVAVQPKDSRATQLFKEALSQVTDADMEAAKKAGEKLQLISNVLEAIEETGNLRKACEQYGIKHQTFLLWVSKDKDLADQYARTREIGLEAMAEDIIAISDDSGLDVSVDVTGKPVVNGEAIQRARLRTDNRRWLLSKLLPKKYGDKLDLTSGGESLTKTRVIRPAQPNGQ